MHQRPDTLLIFLLKGAAPEKYRERMEVGGALAQLNFNAMTDQQLARSEAGEHPYAVLAPTRDLLGPGAGEPPVTGEILVPPPQGEDSGD